MLFCVTDNLLTSIPALALISSFNIVPFNIFELVTAPSAIVELNTTSAIPLNDTLGEVTSPLKEKFLAVCNAVAVPALPLILPLIVLLNVQFPVIV
jgi:hypothetical protein